MNRGFVVFVLSFSLFALGCGDSVSNTTGVSGSDVGEPDPIEQEILDSGVDENADTSGGDAAEEDESSSESKDPADI